MTDPGLSVSEAAEVLTAQAPIRTVCTQAARRELELSRPELAYRFAEADRELTAAEARLAGPRAALEPLQAELEATRRELAECQVISDDDSRQARISKRSNRVALAEEEQELSQRVHLVQDALSPLIATAGEARMQRDRAAVRLQALDVAASDPLASAAGLATMAGREWLAYTGQWMRHLGEAEANTMMGRASRAFLMGVLRETKLGELIERNALGHGKLQQDRRTGVVVDESGLVFASSPGWDGKGAPPSSLQFSEASARADVALSRWQAAAVGEPSAGLHVVEVAPMNAQPQPSLDMSMTPGEFGQ